MTLFNGDYCEIHSKWRTNSLCPSNTIRKWYERLYQKASPLSGIIHVALLYIRSDPCPGTRWAFNLEVVTKAGSGFVGRTKKSCSSLSLGLRVFARNPVGGMVRAALFHCAQTLGVFQKDVQYEIQKGCLQNSCDHPPFMPFQIFPSWLSQSRVIQTHSERSEMEKYKVGP